LPKITTINSIILQIAALKKHFSEFSSLSIKDILEFYISFDETVKKATVKWRIYKLIEKGVLKRIGRGKYALGEQIIFTPEITSDIESIYSIVDKQFPYLEKSIWTTKWLNQWMLHIPNKHLIILDVEKDAEENVFYHLKESKKNVFIHTEEDIINKYADDDTDIVIIKNLITDSPLQKIKRVEVPTLEKIMVDLIVDTRLFSAYQDKDLDSIIENAFEYYTINIDRLLRYASRRRKKDIVANRIGKNRL